MMQMKLTSNFLNHHSVFDTEFERTYKKIIKFAQITEFFSSVTSENKTLTETQLSYILMKTYFEQIKMMTKNNFTTNSDIIMKLLNIIVITNEMSNDDVKSVIINAIRKLNKYNISF